MRQTFKKTFFLPTNDDNNSDYGSKGSCLILPDSVWFLVGFDCVGPVLTSSSLVMSTVTGWLLLVPGWYRLVLTGSWLVLTISA